MGKMNSLSADLEEVRKCTSKLSEIVSTISEILGTINDIVISIESTFATPAEQPNA